MLKTIEHLTARWDAADKNILRHVFPLLSKGQPVQIKQIADEASVSIDLVEKALAEGRASLDAEGRVIELSGLMLAPSLNRLEVNGVALFSCCALLAHMTPLLFDCDVKLESVDPQNRGFISLELTPSTVTTFTPTSAVGSFVETEPMSMETNIGAAFCSHVHHFTDRESANIYVEADKRRYVVEIRELRESAEKLYRAVWS